MDPDTSDNLPPDSERANQPSETLADLLDEALALGAEARAEFLRQVESRDPVRACELRELIAVLPDPEPRDLADRIERGVADPVLGEPAIGTTVGGCVLESVLGRGGIGTVFSARQIDPPRAVAVKVLRLANARASHFRRFRIEAQALARLVHPSIARIYASGTERHNGLDHPFIVLERVDGERNIVGWARERGVARTDIARALAEVCDGMQLGHNLGVVHRDLKPSNILVGSDGRPRIIDFGVARLVAPTDPEQPDTLAGAIIGTPAYMAPEQFELPPSEIDTRIDIHALGVILYEAIVGRRPYEIPRHLYFDAASVIRSTDPPAPHLADSTIPRDLSAVIMKAMAKDRTRRYETMNALADDLRAFAEGRSVRARPESGPERFLRLIRRNPVPAAAAVITTSALVVASSLSFGFWRTARTERDIARAERDHVRIELATIDAERGLIPLDGDAVFDLSKLEPSLVGAMIRREVDDAAYPVEFVGDGNLYSGAMSGDGRRWVGWGDGDQLGMAEFDGGGAAPRVQSIRMDSPAAAYGCGALKDGSRFFASSFDGRFCEMRPGGSIRDLLTIGWVARAIVPSGDGKRLLFLGGTHIGSYDLESGKIEGVQIGDGAYMGSGAWDGVGVAYTIRSDRTVVPIEVPPSGSPRLLDSPRFDVRGPRAIALSPDGTILAVGSNHGALHLFDRASGSQIHRIDLRNSIWSLAFSRSGSRLFAGDRAGRVITIRVAEGSVEETRSSSFADPVWALGEAVDGTLAASIGGKMVFFSGSPSWRTKQAPLPAFPRAVRLLAPHTVRAVAVDGMVRDLDLARGTWEEVANGRMPPLTPAGAAAISPDGRFVAVIGDEEMLLRDLSTGAMVRPVIPAVRRVPYFRAEWNEDGSLLAVGCKDWTLVLRPDGSEVAQIPTNAQEIIRITWYGPDRFILTRDITRGLDCIIDGGAIRSTERELLSASELIRTGGRWVVPALTGSIGVSAPGGCERLPSADNRPEFTLSKHRDFALDAKISPDGKLLASVGADGTVRLWSMSERQQLTAFSAHEQQAYWLSWLPDGSGIVSMGALGEVHLLDSVPLADRIAQDSTAKPRPAYGQ
jgi:serine/threonine protein kinase